ncbi:predicted protein [Nematostella vectensis]|uniref:Major facilitator superfamily associated domain-containing protein n=2 Tax=Nematostella vectensis TaxID=45351 RepID=A7S080_NEMVE|nr:major facilitator superfamily domain-containing protein 6-A isoform X2 [Nematostella vectensis]EDO42916.1 predicted protein [Nematostella vectensis]|eukprot:XP_001634979.1 predicted protein [Nematostella vectensis]
MAKDEDIPGDAATQDLKKDKVCGFNRKYLIPKGFYFFFFAAQGSLLPYLSLYLKQLELPASQVGIITGIKPYIAFFFIPVWSAIADKYRISRLLFFISTIAINLGLLSYAFAPMDLCEDKSLRNVTKFHRSVEFHGIPYNISYMERVTEMAQDSSDLTPWPQGDQIAFEGTDTYHSAKKTQVFLYLLLVTVFFTVISCPSLTFGDSATVQLLRENNETHKYGKQRLWGSIGWGMMAFLVGAAVSKTHLCPPGSAKRKDVNYYPCFYTYGGFMLIALFIGLKLDFEKNKSEPDNVLLEDIEIAEHSSEPPQRKSVLKGIQSLMTAHYMIFLTTVFYVGIAMGLIKVFLFWHLKDLGGTQMLFSIMSGVNCVAEVTVYFLSSRLISSFGAVRVLWLGLMCYSFRLFFYAFVKNPWYVIPIETLSGVTTAGVWASLMSFVGNTSVEGATFTLQGILHSVHWGLGHGCGEFIGGFFISAVGAPRTFALFGVLSLADLGAYVLIDHFATKTESPGDGYEKVSTKKSPETGVDDE